MRRILIFSLLFFPVFAFALEIKSEAFNNGARIPSKYTCDAQDVSPVLGWSDVAQGTKSFVLICSDPDAPFKAWTHWVIFNIPQDKRNLAEDVPKKGRLNDGSIQGVTDFGRTGYGGPCPPPGAPHRYFFKLYCLDSELLLNEKATKDEVLKAIKGHVIAEAQTYGVYSR